MFVLTNEFIYFCLVLHKKRHQWMYTQASCVLIYLSMSVYIYIYTPSNNSHLLAHVNFFYLLFSNHLIHRKIRDVCMFSNFLRYIFTARTYFVCLYLCKITWQALILTVCQLWVHLNTKFCNNTHDSVKACCRKWYFSLLTYVLFFLFLKIL